VKLSVYTPSHKGDGLDVLWHALRNQTHQNFEWVVAVNGMRAADIAHKLVAYNDPRIHIVYPRNTTRIGELKGFAVSRCTGDALVEIDHDDVIYSQTLELIAARFADAPPKSFVYSDCITLRDNNVELYGEYYGWQRNGNANATPEVSARSLGDILFAPDHIRAWSREAYDAAGGYDPTLEVCDDQDLMCRTYLAGCPFLYIDQPLYVHQLTSACTSQQKLDHIKATSSQLRDRYLHSMVAEECNRSGALMFDLGGAHNNVPGFIPVDKHLGLNHRYRGDVFEVVGAMLDGSVGAFRAFDFLEHVPTTRVVELMNLLHRKLRVGGYLLTHTPAVCDAAGRSGRGAFQDPTHVSYWSSNNFWYFTSPGHWKYVPEITADFIMARAGTWYPSDFHKEHLIPYTIWDGVKRGGYQPHIPWPS